VGDKTIQNRSIELRTGTIKSSSRQARCATTTSRILRMECCVLCDEAGAAFLHQVCKPRSRLIGTV